MAIQLTQAPAGAQDLVRAGLIELPPGSVVAVAVGQAQPGDLQLAIPHPVYIADAEDLVDNGRLDRAELVAWRYLLFSKRVPIASIEPRDPDSGEFRVSNVNVGPYVPATFDAIQKLEALEATRDRDYELAEVEIPGLYVMAIWLRNLGEGEDIVFPIGPEAPHAPPPGVFPPQPLESARLGPAPISVAEFGSLVRTARTHRATNFDDSPR